MLRRMGRAGTHEDEGLLRLPRRPAEDGESGESQGRRSHAPYSTRERAGYAEGWLAGDARLMVSAIAWAAVADMWISSIFCKRYRATERCQHLMRVAAILTSEP